MKKTGQRILSINVNSFGGRDKHLMNHQTREKRIDWKGWSQIDKSKEWLSFTDYIMRIKPDIVFVEEMLVSCYERINYLYEMANLGYSYFAESLPDSGNYSLTMAFYKEGERPEYVASPGNYRQNRTVICHAGGILLIGSHFPYESDAIFLTHVYDFIQSNQEGNLLLIGDLNANDPNRGNKKTVNKLLENGMIDLWTAAGRPGDTPTEVKYGGRLDYAIASQSLAKNVQNIEIDPFPMESGMTDHAAVIVDIAS